MTNALSTPPTEAFSNLSEKVSVSSVESVSLPQQFRIVSGADPLRDPAFYEVGHALGDAQLFAYHGVKNELAEVLWSDKTEFAVVVAGGSVIQFLGVLFD